MFCLYKNSNVVAHVLHQDYFISVICPINATAVQLSFNPRFPDAMRGSCAFRVCHVMVTRYLDERDATLYAGFVIIIREFWHSPRAIVWNYRVKLLCEFSVDTRIAHLRVSDWKARKNESRKFYKENKLEEEKMIA